MNPTIRKSEMTKAIMGLSRTNRDYIMAITRALTFAQNTTTEPKPDSEKCCQQDHATYTSQKCPYQEQHN